VSRGDISLFQRELSDFITGDELLISAKGLHWREANFKLELSWRKRG
jgi:hypothetical protein